MRREIDAQFKPKRSQKLGNKRVKILTLCYPKPLSFIEKSRDTLLREISVLFDIDDDHEISQ